MSDAPLPYARLASGERLQFERPLVEAIFDFQRLFPLSRARFDRQLDRALAEAARLGTGFSIGGFAARRALGPALLVDIDPQELTKRLDHRFRQGERVFNIRNRFLGAGDWGPLLRGTGNSGTHREVVEIVAAKFDYRATKAYHEAMERASGPKPIKRNFVALSSPAKVEAYFRATAELCRSVHDNGVVRRGEFGWRLARPGGNSVRLPWVELGEVDIGVAIGPTGTLYRFASGKHRTAAAQALGLKSMPVEVRMVHAEWLRRHMEETGLSPSEALLHGIRYLAPIGG